MGSPFLVLNWFCLTQDRTIISFYILFSWQSKEDIGMMNKVKIVKNNVNNLKLHFANY